MSEKSTSSSSGIGFCGMLTILFIGLKLAKIITWPWVWVLSPMWLSLAAGVAILVIVGIGALVLLLGTWIVEKVT